MKRKWELIIDLERTIAFNFHFFLKEEPIIPSSERLIITKICLTSRGADFSSNRNLLQKLPPLMRGKRYRVLQKKVYSS